jgi:hypothetical protein
MAAMGAFVPSGEAKASMTFEATGRCGLVFAAAGDQSCGARLASLDRGRPPASPENFRRVSVLDRDLLCRTPAGLAANGAPAPLAAIGRTFGRTMRGPV